MSNELIAGPVVNPEKRDPRLPDYLEQVEFLQMKTDKENFYEVRYPNNDESVKRIKALDKKIKPLGFRYDSFVPKEIVIALTESCLNKLNPEERQRAKPYLFNRIEAQNRPPHLIRFIKEKKYIDSFFEKGEIMLSSFNNCKNLEDKNRQDTKEGSANLVGTYKEVRCEIGSGIGINPFLFCMSSYTVSPDELLDYKSRPIHNPGIIINEPTILYTQIVQALSKRGIHVSKVIFSPCDYSDRIIQRSLNVDPSSFIHPENNTIEFSKLFELQANMMGDDIFLAKEKKFSYEREWRFVFITEGDQNLDNIIIKIDDPNSCCTPYYR